MVKFWKEEPSVFPALCDYAINDVFQRAWDSHKIPRQAAIQEIIKLFLHKPEAFSLLKDRAVNDLDEQVRYDAIKGLPQIPHGFLAEEGLFNFFYERVENDAFQRQRNSQLNPRFAALNVLVKDYPHDPKTTELLRDRAINDPDPKLREWAQQQLEQWEQKN